MTQVVRSSNKLSRMFLFYIYCETQTHLHILCSYAILIIIITYSYVRCLYGKKNILTVFLKKTHPDEPISNIWYFFNHFLLIFIRTFMETDKFCKRGCEGKM